MKRLLAGLLLAALASAGLLAADTLDVYFIDVGQGDAILIDYGSSEMLIDGGPSGSCIPLLAEHVDGYLEVVVATHPHSDHVGGLDDVLRAFDVLRVISNGESAATSAYTNFIAAVEAEGCPHIFVGRNDLIKLADLEFRVLHPHRLSGDANEDSLVLLMTYGGVGFLFTGDIEAAAEAELLQMHCLSDIDVLKVAHHGSRYGTTSSFLAVAQPELAIYSAGDGNRYGHPHEEALLRLEAAGADVLGTDQCGTVHVSCTRSDCSVSSGCGSLLLGSGSASSLGGECALLITEVEMNPPGNDSGAEWIELHNPTDEPIPIAGWQISYTANVGDGWDDLPAATILPGEYYQFFFSKRHLENTRGVSIYLHDSAGATVDHVIEGLQDEVRGGGDARTWQRVPDGPDTDDLDDWVFKAGTPGERN